MAMSTVNLASDVRYLKGVGPGYAGRLAKLGIHTVADLIRTFPVGYLDRGTIVPIARATAGQVVTVEGRVRWVRAESTRRMPLVRAEIEDRSGTLKIVFFNQPWIVRSVHVGDTLTVTGEVKPGREMHPRAYEVGDAGEEAAHAAGIVPRYGLGSGVPIRWFRRLMSRTVKAHAGAVEDPLPDGLRRRNKLAPIGEAIAQIHFPDDWKRLERARQSLAYEEFFLLEAMLALRRAAIDRAPGIVITVGDRVDARIRARLPFRLTAGQEQALAHIRADMASGRPMNRLLQGDVGCGKTAVAAAAILATVAARHQAALMAPTEILVDQHHRTFTTWLEGSRVRIAQLKGGMKPRTRAPLLEAIAAGEVDLVIATHAVVQRDVTFASLALTVIDEQQRFGVGHRARLVGKGDRPHVLVMTATPIPRTLAMTLYGDLDVSVIKEMPPGRQPITTRFERGRDTVLEAVRERLREGRQAFFVYPLIDDSDKLPLKAAKASAEELTRAFPEFGVGLLHGKMKREEKDEIMQAFREGRIQVLVSTIVVEVGIDVPNATVMVIDHAERYGLAQLHQLRGRIGRGNHPSTCILLGDPRTPEARARIEAAVRFADGFAVAEEDLKLRGPGEWLGTRQSGWPEFHVADPVRDVSLLAAAREDAFALARREPKEAERLRTLFAERLKLASIG